MNKKVKIALVVLVLVGIAGAVVVYKMWNKPTRTVADEKGIEMTAADLVKEYQANESFNGKLVRAYTIQWRYYATQNMISSIELLRTLYCNNIADGFHYTDQMLVAHAIGANGTNVGIAYIKAALAKANV